MADKLYIPQDLLNSNYTYVLTPNDYITINTNTNCTSGYNIQCTCYRVDYNHYYRSSAFNCSTNTSSYQIPFDSLTSNIYYRNDFPSIVLMVFCLSIMLIYFPYKMFSRLFGRWLKI